MVRFHIYVVGISLLICSIMFFQGGAAYSQSVDQAMKLHNYYTTRNKLYSYNVFCHADSYKNSNVLCSQSILFFPQIPMPTMNYDFYGNPVLGMTNVESKPIVSGVYVNHNNKWYKIDYSLNSSIDTINVKDAYMYDGDVIEVDFKNSQSIKVSVGNGNYKDWERYKRNLEYVFAWENSSDGKQATANAVNDVIARGNAVLSGGMSSESNNCAAQKYMFERQKDSVKHDEELLKSMQNSGSIFSGTQASNLSKSRQRLYDLESKLSKCN